MAKKLKRPIRRSPRSAQDAEESRWLLRKLFQPRNLIIATTLVLVGLGFQMVSGWLPDLTQREEYLVDLATISVTEPPRIVPTDFLEVALHKAGLPGELSLLDETITEQIFTALQQSPWVAHVHRVTKSSAAGIVAELEYRIPVAMVEVTRGVYPIDSQGTLLPPEDFTVNDTKKFPLIVGILSTPQGPEGTSWGDSRVEQAAGLAALLAPYWQDFHLQKIVCPAKGAAEPDMYSLITEGGSTILWGAAPGQGRPGEPDTGQKITRIKKYLKRFGDFHHPNGPYEIDIRHWQEISRRPMTAGLYESVR